MNSGSSISSGTGFGQFFADRTPRYDRQVLSRRAKVYRPDKRNKKKIKWL
jgi:hypothetical protein